jgi:SAM-dependent methyltransferase
LNSAVRKITLLFHILSRPMFSRRETRPDLRDYKLQNSNNNHNKPPLSNFFIVPAFPLYCVSLPPVLFISGYGRFFRNITRLDQMEAGRADEPDRGVKQTDTPIIAQHSMAHCTFHNYAQIDWKQLRDAALAEKGWKSKTSAEWDRKAQSFAHRNRDAEYSRLFLAELPLHPEYSVLDIGSGPGTLALPIARKVARVTALDFSQGMLDSLEAAAEKEQICNISTRCLAWEDDWQKNDLHPHDIAIASRSMGVKDLAGALEKINSFATKYVFISDRVGATPFDRGAFEAVGRPFLPGPDYIFTINFLYKLGIHPNMTILRMARDYTFRNLEEAMDSYTWMFQDLSSDELARLRRYVLDRTVKREAGQFTVRRPTPPEWALIWWQKIS